MSLCLLLFVACGGAQKPSAIAAEAAPQIPDEPCANIAKSKLEGDWFQAAPFMGAKLVVRADFDAINSWNIASEIHALASEIPDSPYPLFMERGNRFVAGSGQVAAAIFDHAGREQAYWTNGELPATDNGERIFGLHTENWSDAKGNHFVRASWPERNTALITKAARSESFAKAFCSVADSEQALLTPTLAADIAINDFSGCRVCASQPTFGLTHVSRTERFFRIDAELHFASEADAERMRRDLAQRIDSALSNPFVFISGYRNLIGRTKVVGAEKRVKIEAQILPNEAKSLLGLGRNYLRMQP